MAGERRGAPDPARQLDRFAKAGNCSDDRAPVDRPNFLNNRGKRHEPGQRQVWKPPGILGRRHHLRGRRRTVRIRAVDWFRDRRTLRTRIGRLLALCSRLCVASRKRSSSRSTFAP